jgi:hypothetical protein
MPSVQTRLTGFNNVSDIWKPTATKRSGQRKLTELKKVVSIKGGALNFDISELLEARELLETIDVPVAHILDSLRRLSCLDITREMLLQTKIGPAIRCTCCHDLWMYNCAVAQADGRLPAYAYLCCPVLY